MQQFFSPCLISVTFHGDGKTEPNADYQALASTISLLPTACLEELTFKHLPSSTPIHLALSEIVQRLNARFKRLATGFSLSDAAWAHLISLPNLESFWVSGTPSAEIHKSKPRENGSPTLKSVLIEVDDACQCWSPLFSLLGSGALQRVAIVTSRKIQDVDVPRQVTIAIIEAKLQRNLNALAFAGFNPTNSSFIPYLGSFNSLEVLWCNTWCRGSGQCISQLTDSDVEQLASGLPRLTSLWLGHGCKYNAHNTTIKSMISLSTRCPSLESLGLPCNLTHISKDVKTESGEPDPRLGVRSSSKLRYLAFQWIVLPSRDDVEGLKTVASCLSHLFPELRPGGQRTRREARIDNQPSQI